MLINITELVNDMILPSIESSDIVGLANISNVCEWYLIKDVSPALVATLHDAGVFPTLLLASGLLIAGSGYLFGDTENAKAVEEDIKARTFITEPPRGLPA